MTSAGSSRPLAAAGNVASRVPAGTCVLRCNAIMQLAAPDHLRGRVIGLYFYAFNGTGAVAGILTGWLCAVGGTELSFVVSGLIGIVAVGATALALGWTPRLTTRRRADQPQHA